MHHFAGIFFIGCDADGLVASESRVGTSETIETAWFRDFRRQAHTDKKRLAASHRVVAKKIFLKKTVPRCRVSCRLCDLRRSKAGEVHVARGCPVLPGSRCAATSAPCATLASGHAVPRAFQPFGRVVPIGMAAAGSVFASSRESGAKLTVFCFRRLRSLLFGADGQPGRFFCRCGRRKMAE